MHFVILFMRECLACTSQSLPTKLPMLNTIAGLSKRIIELFDALDKFASEDEPWQHKGAAMRCAAMCGCAMWHRCR